MDCLTKEQMLLLQNHLPYSKYEEFMSMFKKEEFISRNKEDFIEDIVKLMEEHCYWGDWFLWGENRVYKRIPKNRFQEEVNSKYMGWLGEYLYPRYFPGTEKFSCHEIKKSDVIRFLDEYAELHKQTFGDNYPDNIDTSKECYPVNIWELFGEGQ